MFWLLLIRTVRYQSSPTRAAWSRIVLQKIVQARHHAVRRRVVVAILGTVQHPAPLALEAGKVILQRLQQALRLDALLVEDKLFDGGQAVGGVDVAVSFQRAAQVADAAIEDGLAAPGRSS